MKRKQQYIAHIADTNANQKSPVGTLRGWEKGTGW